MSITQLFCFYYNFTKQTTTTKKERKNREENYPTIFSQIHNTRHDKHTKMYNSKRAKAEKMNIFFSRLYAYVWSENIKNKLIFLVANFIFLVFSLIKKTFFCQLRHCAYYIDFSIPNKVGRVNTRQKIKNKIVL